MHLNHINIPVQNVAETVDFFVRHFDFVCTQSKGDNALAVLKGAGDFTLVIMSRAFNKNNVHEFPSSFHIGFLLENRDEVTDQYNKMKIAGVLLENEPTSMRGVFGFYFIAPGNILVEVSST